jgi:hypothetical protein
MYSTFVCPFFLASQLITPKHGAKKGIQYLNTRTSGRRRLMRFPTLNHVTGLIESTIGSDAMTSGVSPCSCCDVPGKRNAGYWREKVKTLTV